MFKHNIKIFVIVILLGKFSFSQWTQLTQVSNIGFYPSISAANCNTVVIAGGFTNSPIVYFSSNGGNNFSNITTAEITRELYSCWAINKDTIFLGDGGSPGGGGGNARVYRTTNSGVNWTIVLTTGGSSGFISGIVFERPAQNFGIAVSDPPGGIDSFWIAKTTDKGGSWRITKAPYVPQYSTQNSPYVVDSLFYGFGIVNPSFGAGKIYKTSNGGLNWNTSLIGLNANSVPSIAFQTDKLNGIAVSDIALPNIATTTNGGANWQSYSIGAGTAGVGTIKWIRGTNIYYLCANTIRRTSNGGLNWEVMNTGGILNFVHMDIITNSPTSICAYALTEDGRVLKYEGDPFGIKPISTELPEKFELMQNYPNPFNPATKIQFNIPLLPAFRREVDVAESDRRGVLLKIFDIIGREIHTLVNEELKPGTYEVSFDGGNLPSGVYYYNLSVLQAGSSTGDYSETKKMVILK